MLLRSQTGERLKPVGVVRRPILDGPVLHRCGNDIGHGRIERLAPLDGPEQAAVHFFWEALPNHARGEDVAAEDAVDALYRCLAAIKRAYGGGHGGWCLGCKGWTESGTNLADRDRCGEGVLDVRGVRIGELGIDGVREIALPEVTHNRNDQFACALRAFRDLERGPGDRAAGDSGENAFLSSQPSGSGNRVVVGDANDL